MKNILLILLIFCGNLFAQLWNDEIELSNISTINVEEVENFANKDGIHIVMRNIGGTNPVINYYLINCAGTLLDSETISTNGYYPNIVGDNENVYILFLESGYIKIKKSTTGGINWNDKKSQYISSTNYSGLDVFFDGNYIHAAWSRLDVNINKVYYKKYDVEVNSWDEYQEITNSSGEKGKSPSITVASDGKIHISYVHDQYYVKSRSKTSSWGSTENVHGYEPNRIWERSKIFASISKLFCSYGLKTNFVVPLYVVDYGSNGWNSNPINIGVNYHYHARPSFVELANDNVYIFYSRSNNIYSRRYTDSWGSPISLGGRVAFASELHASAAYNDIYLVWNDDQSNNLKYRQYDSAPQTPQSFAGQKYNNKPKLTWAYNKEPDIQYYEVWRQIKKLGQAPGAWTLRATTTSNSYVDNEIYLGSAFIGSVKYKVRARDNENNLSPYTSVKTFAFSGFNKIVYSEDDGLTEYSLKQNYPNPFNPETTIEYALPAKSSVKLSVFNMLGEKAATLIDGVQESGVYQVYWNAGGFPSGVYVYRLEVRSGDKTFTQNKRMILMK